MALQPTGPIFRPSCRLVVYCVVVGMASVFAGAARAPISTLIMLRRAMEMVDTKGVEATELRLPRLMNLLRFGESIRVSEGGDILVTVDVQPDSGLDSNTVADTLGRIRGLTAVAVIRGRNLLAPRGDTCFAAGDQLLAMTHPDVHKDLLLLAGSPRSSLEFSGE